jgi:hypothetical protein
MVELSRHERRQARRLLRTCGCRSSSRVRAMLQLFACMSPVGSGYALGVAALPAEGRLNAQLD